MSYEKKVILSFFIAISIAIIALGYDTYSYYRPTPTFKSGECISRLSPADEFFPEKVSDLILKIEKIGKQSYLAKSYLVGREEYWDYYVLNINIGNKIYVLVNCETGKKK